MALDLGELVGYMRLDTKGVDTAVGELPGKVSKVSPLMGGAALAVGGVVAGALIAGVNSAIDFESTNNIVAAGLGLTADESARVGTLAGQVYADNYGESVEQVQSTIGGIMTSLSDLEGANDETTAAMTAKVLNYASAFETDTASAISTVQTLLNSGLVKSSDEAMDLMVSGMQKVPEALRGDLTDALTEYGPLLAGMGFTGEQAFDLLVKSSEGGAIAIDKTGDALKEFGIRATDMSTASVGAYDTLGLSAEDMSNRILAGGDSAQGALDEIVTGLLGIEDPATRANTAIALFGTPIEDLGVNGIPAFLSSLQGLGGGMSDAGGAADAMGETMANGAGSKIAEMNRQVEVLLATVGEMLLPVLTAVFGYMAENPAVIQILAAAFGVLALAFVGVTIATWAMNTALLANPITWIILAIVALIAALVLLIMNWDAVVAWVSEVWQGFIVWLAAVIVGFISWWNGVWEGFASWIGQLWDGIVAWIVGVWEGFIGWIVGMLIAYVSFWVGLWNNVLTAVQTAWNAIVAWVTGIVVRFVIGIVSRFNAFVATIAGVWRSISTGVTTAWNGIISFLSGIPGKITSFFGGALDMLRNVGRDVVNGLLNGLKGAWSMVTSWISNAAAGVANTFKNVLGIKSPSRVFAGFGRNTVEGYMKGLDDLQPDLDARMQDLVDVPEYGSSMRDAQRGAQGVPAANAGVVAQANMTINGNVGWMPDEVAERIDAQSRVAESLSGIDEEVGVS